MNEVYTDEEPAIQNTYPKTLSGSTSGSTDLNTYIGSSFPPQIVNWGAPTPPYNPIDWSEVQLREKAIQWTLKAFEKQDVEYERFATVLEQFYNFIKYGTKLNNNL